MVRWKDKSKAVLAADDRMPVTDVSDTNVDKYTTPTDIVIAGGGVGPFVLDSGNIYNVGGSISSDNFVFGSTQTDGDAEASHDARMFFHKTRYAFRAGASDGNKWDTGNLGSGSFAVGYDTVALGNYSAAFGKETGATGDGSVVMGREVVRTGDYSLSAGIRYRAASNYELSIGRGTSDTDTSPAGFVALCADRDQDFTNKSAIEIATSTGATDPSNLIENRSGDLYFNGSNLSAPVVAAADVAIADSGDEFNATNTEDALVELAVKTDKNGYDRYDVDSMPDVTNSGNVISVAVKSGQSSFHFWTNNKKITKTTTQTVTIPDTTGTYYVYFDASGVLQYILQDSVTSIAFYKFAITAFCYYNSETAELWLSPDELHGKDLSGVSHESTHMTDGAKYSFGLRIEGLSDGSSVYTQSTVGVFYDEDIPHVLATNATGHSMLYRYGPEGAWRKFPADLTIAHKEAADTYFSWNKWDGTNWVWEEGTPSTDYWITFFLATPSGIQKIVGQNAYSSRLNARNAIETEVNNINSEGLPNPEMVWLGAVIVKRNGTLEDLADGSVFYSLTTTRGGGGRDSGTSYASDTPTDTTNFDGVLSSTDVNVQMALETIDDLSVTTSMIDGSTGTAGQVATTDGTEVTWADGGGGGGYSVASRTVSSDIVLQVGTDSNVQALEPTLSIGVTLSDTGATNGDFFIIENKYANVGYAMVNVKNGSGVSLFYIGKHNKNMFIYDGTEWLAFGQRTDGAVLIGTKTYLQSHDTLGTVLIGNEANGRSGAVSIGKDSGFVGIYATSVGYGAIGKGDYGVAVGKWAEGGNCGSAVGYFSKSGSYSSSLGASSRAENGDYSIALGAFSLVNRDGEFFIGADTLYPNDVGRGSVQFYDILAGGSSETEIFIRDIASARLTLQSSSIMTGTVEASMIDFTSGDTASYSWVFTIQNIAGTTTLKVNNKTVLHEDDASWDMNLVADDTNNSLKITALGDDTNPTEAQATVRYSEIRS